MGVLNDFWCNSDLGGCGKIFRDVVLPSGETPKCHEGMVFTRWDHGQPPSTDMRSPSYNHAVGRETSGSRETNMIVAQQTKEWNDRNQHLGHKWEAPIQAGDSVHGAKPDHTIRGTSFSGAGMTHSRMSSGERESNRRKHRQMGKTSAPSKPMDDYAVEGIAPTRMTRDEARERRASSHYTD